VIAPLPEVAAPASQPVECLRRLGHEPSQRPTERIQLGCLQKYVDMVGHQRVAEQFNLIGTDHLPQMVQEHFEVLRGGEVELTVVAASHHMHGPPGA